MSRKPSWKLPNNLAKAIEDGDGIWEDDRWSPIILTAMTGTELAGRSIPIAWQAEFEPFEEEFESANEALEENGVEPDGYGWGEYIKGVISDKDSALAERLHLNDCESGTCVIWVETEADCQHLVETIWDLIYRN